MGRVPCATDRVVCMTNVSYGGTVAAARENNTEMVEPGVVAEPTPTARQGRSGTPLRAQVVGLIRDSILNFHYKPGQRLIERELIERFEVSRTTIREALRELTSEGLLQSIPQRGVVVVVPTPQDALEMYELRAALESLAARKFVERASDTQVAKLRAALDRLDVLISEGGSTLDVLRAKDVFYETLLSGCGNRAVHETLKGLQARISLLRATSLGRPGRLTAARDELHAVMSAIEARNAEAAARACGYHVEQAKRAGLEGLGTPVPSVPGLRRGQ